MADESLSWSWTDDDRVYRDSKDMQWKQRHGHETGSIFIHTPFEISIKSRPGDIAYGFQ